MATVLNMPPGEQQDDPVDYGPKFLDLPKDRIEQLQGICNKLNQRDQWARQLEIIRCTLKRYFWIGLQHVFWNSDSQCMQVGQVGGPVFSENMNEETTAMQDFNIYKANGKIFASVFAQNPATVRMEPDQPLEPASQRAAQEAQKYIRVYDKYNPAQDAQIKVGYFLWNDGRVISITESNEDQTTEETRYVGVLESKVPIFETDFEMWPYCKVSKEHDILTMKEKHPDVADQLTAGGKSASPNDEIARMARVSTAEAITQLSHDTLQYLVTEDRYWLRLSAFGDLPEKADRDFWAELFPEGCKLTFCGQVFCGADAVSMDKALALLNAEPGEGQARNALGDPHVPVQMEFNDAMNLTSELLKFCVPSLWVDMTTEELAAVREQLAQYGQVRPFNKKGPNEALSNSFYAEESVEAPAILQAWIENLQGPLTQLVTLNQPAMFGANMEDQKTAKAYQQALQQSLGVLTIVWSPYKSFAAKIREQAAMIASQREKKFAAIVAGKKKGEDETVEIDPNIMRGGFTCSGVADQSFPASPDMKSQTWKGLKAAAAQDPTLAREMDLPDNKKGFNDAVGLDDFVMEGADARDKQLAEWAQMQKGEGPEPDQQATDQQNQQRQQQAAQAGATLGTQLPPPPPVPKMMKSSIPVDPICDDHVAEAQECFKILNSPDGLKIKNTLDMGDGRKGLAIWTDLKLHMIAHMAAGMAKGLIFLPPLGSGMPPMPGPGGPAMTPPPTGGPTNAPPS